MTTPHLTSLYIVADASGKKYLFSYRPTDAYSGRRDSDQSAMYYLPFMFELAHGLELGASVTIGQNHTNSSTTTQVAGVILATKVHGWDYSKPIGERNIEVSQSDNWDNIFAEYRSK